MEEHSSRKDKKRKREELEEEEDGSREHKRRRSNKSKKNSHEDEEKSEKREKKERKHRKNGKNKEERDDHEKNDEIVKRDDKDKKNNDKEDNGKKLNNKDDKGSKVHRISEKDENVPVSNFRISERNQKVLYDQGIKTLFPIQSQAYDYVFDGKDLIGRARTGTGKTLSFSLPVIESILQNNIKRKGKGPLVMVLAPTRELAKQNEQVMAPLADNLTTTCIYGGVPYSVQESVIYRGLDILVGTPGRIIDFLEKGTINLRELKYFILDEADEMLNMGFRDAIENIYTYIPKENNIQTLLYSATIPEWVKEISAKYLKPDYITIDLIGTDDVQTSVTVKHLAIQTSHRGRLEALADLVGVYSRGGKTMIFSDTKVGANELALSSSISNFCQVLHGDISQKQREITLKSFRDGVFKILVATDVAARGLDINDVDLIIQCSPPKDHENYIHRSGRTGRAGKFGVSLTFYTKREEGIIKMIEKRTGIQFQRVGMPQPKDIYRVSAEGALEDISKVSEEMYKHFLPFAKQCIEDHNGDYERALSSALAVIGGHLKKVKGRSLLSSLEGYTAVLAKSTSKIRTKRYILNIINSELEGLIENNDTKIYGDVALTKDGDAIIDMVSKYAEILIKQHGKDQRFTYSIPNELPELETDEDYQKRINSFVNSQGGGRDDDNYSKPPQRNYNDYSKNKPRGGGRGGYSRNNKSWNDYGSKGRNFR